MGLVCLLNVIATKISSHHSQKKLKKLLLNSMAALILNCMPYNLLYDIIRAVPTQGIYEERIGSLFQAIGPLQNAPCRGGGVGSGQSKLS